MHVDFSLYGSILQFVAVCIVAIALSHINFCDIPYSQMCVFPFLYMLSNELQRFLNEINSESNKSDIITCNDITFVIFTVCKLNGISLNSGLEVLVKEALRELNCLCSFVL